MSKEITQTTNDSNAIATIRDEITKNASSKSRRIGEKFVLAALGAIPWVGGFVAAAASIRSDEADIRSDDLRTKWLEEHDKKFANLGRTLDEISNRFESFGNDVEERVQSSEYLALVRHGFRTWDEAETKEKRQYVANLIANCAGTRVCSDDVVRLFISWLSVYHENHFAVIREIRQNPGSTRYDIWAGIYGENNVPRDDSAEADMYRMLIRDLSMGGVIRQPRDTNEAGQFVRKRPAKRRSSSPTTMESAFEDTKQYTLTELGKQFVHYTMNETIGRIDTEHHR